MLLTEYMVRAGASLVAHMCLVGVMACANGIHMPHVCHIYYWQKRWSCPCPSVLGSILTSQPSVAGSA